MPSTKKAAKTPQVPPKLKDIRAFFEASRKVKTD